MRSVLDSKKKVLKRVSRSRSGLKLGFDFYSLFSSRTQDKLATHNKRQREERIYSEKKQEYCLKNPEKAVHIRLDGMGQDLTDSPWWYKLVKKQLTKLPIRLMGATVSGRKFERLAFLISEFSKEVEIDSPHLPRQIQM